MFLYLIKLLVDTAAVYCNESDIGQALPKLLPKYGLNRNDIHITTKLGKNYIMVVFVIFNYTLLFYSTKSTS